jgi:pimeloyl-ACP methyl ester carboxylesterase
MPTLDGLDGLGGGLLAYRRQVPSGASAGRSDAPPVLFIHGAGGGSLHFAELLRALGRERRCYALDLPGHGGSAPYVEWPDDEALLERYVETAAAFAERVGLGRFMLAGHSMGGALAQLFALRYPDRLSGMALLATSAYLRVSRALMTMLDDYFDSLPQTFAQSSYSSATDPSAVARFAAEQLQCDKRTLLSDFRACNRFDVRDRLGEIELPTVVVSAVDDLMTPPKLQQRLADNLQRARLVTVPRAGHFVYRERPEPVLEAIRQLEGDPPRLKVRQRRDD